MVTNLIFGAFLNTITIASNSALQNLFHWGSGSNGSVATGQ